mgnify:CR=1 FL=1
MIDRETKKAILLLHKCIEVKEELIQTIKEQLGQSHEVRRTEDNKQRFIELEAELKELQDELKATNKSNNVTY